MDGIGAISSASVAGSQVDNFVQQAQAKEKFAGADLKNTSIFDLKK